VALAQQVFAAVDLAIHARVHAQAVRKAVRKLALVPAPAERGSPSVAI
jgi:hypothetical protein